MDKFKYAFKDFDNKVHFFGEFEDVLDAAMLYVEKLTPNNYKIEFIASHKRKKKGDYIAICSVIDNYFSGYELYSFLYLYFSIKKN